MVTISGHQMVPVLLRTGTILGPFRTWDCHDGTIWGPRVGSDSKKTDLAG